MALRSRSRAAAWATALLALAATWLPSQWKVQRATLETGRAFTPPQLSQPRMLLQSGAGRTSARALVRQALVRQGDVYVTQEIRDLKEQLRRAPTQALVGTLERLWQPVDAVVELWQLQGDWSLRGPKDNAVRGWTSGDLSRVLLELYAGDFGRMLSMELVSTPMLKIAADGQTETRTQLRWGAQRDEVRLQGKLSLVAPNLLRQAPQAVQSSALKLAVPFAQTPRDLRVTYHDGELLILRDQRGVVDVLWRTQQDSSSSRSQRFDGAAWAPKAEAFAAAPTPQVPAEAPTQAERLLSEVEVLKSTLEAQRLRATEDRTERQRLITEVARLEKALETASVDSRVDSVKLSALAKLQGSASEAVASRQQKSEEKALAQRQLEEEVNTLRVDAAGLEERVGRLHAREISLRGQVTVLESELHAGNRDTRPAYRAAVAKAKAELNQVHNELRTAQREVAALQRDLGQKTTQLRRKIEEAEAEVAAHRQLEAQLESQKRDFFQQRAQLSEAVANEQVLRAQLERMHTDLASLEQREAKGRELAESVEKEIKQIVVQANEAQQLAKSIRSTGRSFWPWR